MASFRAPLENTPSDVMYPRLDSRLRGNDSCRVSLRGAAKPFHVIPAKAGIHVPPSNGSRASFLAFVLSRLPLHGEAGACGASSIHQPSSRRRPGPRPSRFEVCRLRGDHRELDAIPGNLRATQPWLPAFAAMSSGQGTRKRGAPSLNRPTPNAPAEAAAPARRASVRPTTPSCPSRPGRRGGARAGSPRASIRTACCAPR